MNVDRIKILIVEDEPNIAESLRDILEVLEHDVVGIASSYDETLEFVDEGNVELLLLDIQLKGDKSGIDIANILRASYDLPFIFTTAFADGKTIEKASQMGPYGYLVKPYGMKDIHAAIEVAMSNFRNTQKLRSNEAQLMSDDQLYVKVDSKLVRLDEDSIIYVEAKGDYAMFNTEQTTYIVHSTIKNIESKLNPSKFLKVHRSFIVNLRKIVDIEDTNLVVKDKVIPISRSNKPILIDRINLI